jgi:hypothetical protein
LWGYLTGREKFQGLGADEKIIKTYFKEKKCGALTGLIWFRKRTSGGFL